MGAAARCIAHRPICTDLVIEATHFTAATLATVVVSVAMDMDMDMATRLDLVAVGLV